MAERIADPGVRYMELIRAQNFKASILKAIDDLDEADYEAWQVENRCMLRRGANDAAALVEATAKVDRAKRYYDRLVEHFDRELDRVQLLTPAFANPTYRSAGPYAGGRWGGAR